MISLIDRVCNLAFVSYAILTFMFISPAASFEFVTLISVKFGV